MTDTKMNTATGEFKIQSKALSGDSAKEQGDE